MTARPMAAGTAAAPDSYATLAATSEPVSPTDGQDARERGADPD